MNSRAGIFSKVVLLVALVFVVTSILPAYVSAGTLTSTYMRLERMKTATTGQVRVVFTTSSLVATDDSMTVDFNGADSTTWTGTSGTVNATQTISSVACNTDTGATALPGTPAASGSGAVVTITGLTTLAASTAYCFDLTSATAVTTPSAGEYHPLIRLKNGGAINDSVTVAVRVVADDQVTVTANVPPTFNFVLDSNSTSFTANLSPGTKQQTTARTVTVNTNAKTGWIAWVRNADSNGLYSTAVSKNIAPTTPGTAVNVDASPSTEQYVWGVSVITQGTGAGTTSTPAAFDATASNDGTGVDTAYRQFASSTGTAAGAVVTIRSSATISAITPAASDYTDVVQVIGAGQF